MAARSLWLWAGLAAVLALALLTNTPTAGQTTLTPRGYLPLAMRPLEGVVTWSTTTDDSGAPNPPLTTIPAGARRLHYQVAVSGGGGQAYRIEYRVPTGPLDPPDTGVIAGNLFRLSGSLCYNTAPGCDNPSDPLRPGDYTIRVFVANELLVESTVNVAAGLTPSARSATPAQRATGR